jgi:TIR domain
MKNLDIVKKIAIIPLFLLLAGLLFFAFGVLPGSGFRMTGNMIFATTAGAMLGIGVLFFIEWQQARKINSKTRRGPISAFLSFNPVDKNFARQLTSTLSVNGIYVEITNRIVPASLVDYRSAMKAYDIVIVILSKNHSNSKVLKHEIEAAEALNKDILCIQIDRIPQPTFLSTTRIHFTNPKDAATDLISISEILRKQIDRSPDFEPVMASA